MVVLRCAVQSCSSQLWPYVRPIMRTSRGRGAGQVDTTDAYDVGRLYKWNKWKVVRYLSEEVCKQNTCLKCCRGAGQGAQTL